MVNGLLVAGNTHQGDNSAEWSYDPGTSGGELKLVPLMRTVI